MSETLRNFSEDEVVPTPEKKFGSIAISHAIESSEVLVLTGSEDDDFELDKSVEKVIISGDSVKDYLRSIGKTPLLNAAEEVELASRIEVGLMATQKIKELQETDSDFKRSELMRELTYIER